jgi:hypothetical protein
MESNCDKPKCSAKRCEIITEKDKWISELLEENEKLKAQINVKEVTNEH